MWAPLKWTWASAVGQFDNPGVKVQPLHFRGCQLLSYVFVLDLDTALFQCHWFPPVKTLFGVADTTGVWCCKQRRALLAANANKWLHNSCRLFFAFNCLSMQSFQIYHCLPHFIYQDWNQKCSISPPPFLLLFYSRTNCSFSTRLALSYAPRAAVVNPIVWTVLPCPGSIFLFRKFLLITSMFIHTKVVS